MAKKKIIKSEKIEPKYPISFETFRDIGNWEISNLTSKEPSSFNGWVRIKKYKITIE